MADDQVHLPNEAMPSWILTPAKVDTGRAAKHRLVEEARRLIVAITVLDSAAADASATSALADSVADLSERIAALPHFAAGPAEAGGDDARLLERSGISGAANPLSMPIRLWLDGDRVRGEAVFGYQYEGPPGCVHGGFVAAAFDDMLGTAQTLSGTAGFTGHLGVRMAAPTPLHKKIDYEAGLKSFEGRKITVWARSTCEGTVCAEAEGLFITPRRGMEDDRMARARRGVAADQ